MAPPFRNEQIGSLLRPAELLKARASKSAASHAYDKIDDKAVKDIEQRAINDVVKRQVETGIRPIVSGEYGRHIYYGGFFETLQGMKAELTLPIPDAFRTDFPTIKGLQSLGATTRPAVIATGPINWIASAYLSEWESLRSTIPQPMWHECKMTMPAPSYQHIQLKVGTAFTPSSGYQSDKDYFRDLGKAYAQEIRTLYDHGLRSLQIDDPHLTYFCDENFLKGCKKDGVDSDALLDLYLQAHSYYLDERPEGMHIGVHLCRGNMSGSTAWVKGSYEKIAEKLFRNTGFDSFFLEFDDVEAAGGFEPLRFLPKGKNIVLGLVSTKKVEMEDGQELAMKIHQAAEVIAKAQRVTREEALDSLAISPQCGFSSLSVAGGKGFDMNLMWDKLELVRDVAKAVWKDAV